MKKLFVFALLLSFLIAACDSGNKPVENLPKGYHGVVVEEAMNAQNYTYMRVNENDKEYWIAVPQMDVKEGDVLYYSRSMEMKNFNSKTLNRTFESVLFVEDISKTPAQEPQVVEHPKVNSTKKINVSVEPLKDGQTIEQIYSSKESLEGKPIKVRGMVVKYNADIMGMNWLHIQDGTGKENYDLAVNSKDKAELNKLVIVEGVVSRNKDYGSGYKYDLIIEGAKVTVE